MKGHPKIKDVRNLLQIIAHVPVETPEDRECRALMENQIVLAGRALKLVDDIIQSAEKLRESKKKS